MNWPFPSALNSELRRNIKSVPSSGVSEAYEAGRNSFKNERTLDLGVNSQPQSFSLLIPSLGLFCSNLLLQMFFLFICLFALVSYSLIYTLR